MLISIIIPAGDWDRHLEHTLKTVRAQELPTGVELEVLVALAGRLPQDRPGDVQLLVSPTGTIPDALNLMLERSSGEFVLRVDSRCDLPSSYVSQVVGGFADERKGCIGGAALVLDRGLFGSTYALAFNSPLIGPTVYRYSRKSGPVNTAYLGAWRRDILLGLGGFDPRLHRNQDNELAERIRSEGLLVWYDADIVLGYYNNRTLSESMRHHFEFGRWRMVQRSYGQSALTARHGAALGAIAGAGLAALAASRTHRGRGLMLAVAPIAYVCAALGAQRTAKRLRDARPDIPEQHLHPLAHALCPALAVLINGSWLAGLWTGMWQGYRLGTCQKRCESVGRDVSAH